MSDYTRFRLSRAIKWLVVIAIVAIILGLVYHTTPVQGLFNAPASIYHALPVILYAAAIMLLGISQFAAIFWFLSRGGVDVYYPGDVTTRFSDVWGQDHVLARVQENILFLEDPESIEDHGGFVPGGILLWGPPGTGKTLMAEAMAGETGKPYVFVDPGAFINMFFGVGVLKVKSLFRRLRKLAVRYGGVIVFFDEADSLGSRGGGTGGAAGGGRAGHEHQPGPADLFAACHGFSYLAPDTQSALYARALRDGAARRSGAPAAWPLPADDPDRHGQWRRHGHAAGAAHRDVRPEEAARVLQPGSKADARHAPEAAAEVPHPHRDGDEHAERAGRGAAAARPDRPHVPGRLSVQGRPEADLRGLLRARSATISPRTSLTIWPRSRPTPPAPRSRTW